MNLTIKSKDGLSILQKVYEGYESFGIEKKWQINQVNEDGITTEILVEFKPQSMLEEKENQLIKLIAMETLRIKQMQYLKRYSVKVDNVYEDQGHKNTIPNEVLTIALDSVESSYYVNIITVLLIEYLYEGKDTIDLTSFARFNLRDYNKDFEIKVKELETIKSEVTNGFLMDIDDEKSWDGSFVGNPFEILRAINETMITEDEMNNRQDVDITLIGREDGTFDVSDGSKIINREIVEDTLGFSFEVMDEDTDYDVAFENSMILVLYAIIFLKTKIIYIKDTYSADLRNHVSSYLDNAGAYPEYSPYIIDKK